MIVYVDAIESENEIHLEHESFMDVSGRALGFILGPIHMW